MCTATTDPNTYKHNLLYNVLTAKLTVFERMYSTKSKLRTVESQRFSLDSSECFAGSWLKNLPQELNGKLNP